MLDQLQRLLYMILGLPVDELRHDDDLSNRNIDTNRRRKKAIQLYNRSATIYNQLREKAVRSFPDPDAVALYTPLRDEANQFFDREDFATSVPPARDRNSTDEILQRLLLLRDYLRENIVEEYPNLRSRMYPENQPDWETRYQQLAEQYRVLQAELKKSRHQRDKFASLWKAIDTPEKFTVPQHVLDKLKPLEQQRLLEAVQAYRFRAWTPAAAVSGMILEGLLQRLCDAKNVQKGTISQMIKRLGEAGLLKGYYHNLAEVGEFFRHRAAHPTSEEFDQEKTRLILSSLIVLIREVF